MSIHSDNFAATVDPLFDQLGEVWQFCPHGGERRDIDVLVSTSEPVDSPVGPRSVRTVKTRIGGARGIDPATLNTGADRISGAEYPGGEARPWQITERPIARGGLLVMRVK
jgi:hypothetical protein